MKKTNIVKVELKNINLSEEIKKAKTKMPDAMKKDLDNIISKKKMIKQSFSKKKIKEDKIKIQLEKCFSLLFEAYKLAIENKSEPEPILGVKLLQISGLDSMSGLITRMNHYLKKEKEKEFILVKKTRNKQSTYILVKFGEPD